MLPPDRPTGRGKVMSPCALAKYAADMGLRDIIKPERVNDPEPMEKIRAWKPDVIVVVAFGQILKKPLLDLPLFGCVNCHFSLLPKYRGAAPMQRAVMDGECETGVTIMYMDVGLDTGDVIATEKFPIGDEDDFETVHDTSLLIGSKLLSDTVYAIEDGRATRTPQDDTLATYAKKVEKEDCRVDFSYDARTVSARIRGVTPIPGAFTYLNGKMLKIAKVKAVDGKGKIGEVIEANGVGTGFITVACGSGAIRILQVIPEGKGKMSAGDFVRGRKIAVGDILGDNIKI